MLVLWRQIHNPRKLKAGSLVKHSNATRIFRPCLRPHHLPELIFNISLEEDTRATCGSSESLAPLVLYLKGVELVQSDDGWMAILNVEVLDSAVVFNHLLSEG